MANDPSHVSLLGVRRLIDGLDDALIILLGGRRRLVSLAAAIKHEVGEAPRNPQREHQVRMRARRLGRRLGLPQESCDRLIAALLEDACRQQGVATSAAPERVPPDLGQGASTWSAGMLRPTMTSADSSDSRFRWLRWLPPPVRLAPVLRLAPFAVQARLLETAMQRVLAAPLASGALSLIEGRRLGIEVHDLGLRWVVVLRGGHIRVEPNSLDAEATVRGSATDLLLLASRREDADTLFFQRRLELTGDTELGLTARNLLDQLPWQEIPLGLRIALHRGAGLAQEARAAHRSANAAGAAR